MKQDFIINLASTAIIAAYFIFFLSLNGLDEPDIYITTFRYTEFFWFIDLWDFGNQWQTHPILDVCRTVFGAHEDFSKCAPYIPKIFGIKATQYFLLSALLTSLLLYLVRTPEKRQIILLVLCSPAYIYFITNFTTEILPYFICVLLPFVRLREMLILCALIITIDLGNGLVAFGYLLIKFCLPRSKLITSLLLLLTFASVEILKFLFGFLASGQKLFDVLNYVINIGGADSFSSILYLPVTILSLLFLTPDFIGVYSSILILLVYMLLLISAGQLKETAYQLYVSPSFQTVVFFVIMLPTHAYGKYYIFFLIESLLILSASLGFKRCYYIQCVFIFLVSIELTLWSLL